MVKKAAVRVTKDPNNPDTHILSRWPEGEAEKAKVRRDIAKLRK